MSNLGPVQTDVTQVYHKGGWVIFVILRQKIASLMPFQSLFARFLSRYE